MSVVEIFLEEILVCDTDGFRCATMIVSDDDGSPTVITVEGSAYAAAL
jgi:hypothetical protein